MCLVEVEGIPKLQTGVLDAGQGRHGRPHADRARAARPRRRSSSSCSSTTRSTARSATRAASARCRTSPTAGAAASRASSSPSATSASRSSSRPLIAIDRERCILCYRCVRFSQEISEDYQLVLLERGAALLRRDLRRPPYVAPVQRQHHRAVPRRRADLAAPTASARVPWDIEGAGSVCTLCPAQCNVHFTVRDERVLRVLSRDHDDVDDGWLCDKGRFAYQSIHVDERIIAPLVRDGGELRARLVGARARGGGARRCAARAARVGALAGGGTTNEEGFLLQRAAARGARLAAPRLRASAARCRSSRPARWPPRPLQATVPTSSSPTPSSCSTASRSTTRRSSTCASARACAATACTLAVATSRPSSLDPNADASVRFAPGARRGVPRRAGRRARRRRRTSTRWPTAAGADAADVRALAEHAARRRRGRRGRLGRAAARAARAPGTPAGRCSTSPGASGSRGTRGAGLLEVPAPPTAAACARPASCPTPARGWRRPPRRPPGRRDRPGARRRRGERPVAAAVVRRVRERRDSLLNFRRVAHIDQAYFHPERRRRGLNDTELGGAAGGGGIAKDARSYHAWRDLFEQLK